MLAPVDCVQVVKALPHAAYKGMWFDPATGDTKDAGQISSASGTVTNKPDGKDWLLLLRAPCAESLAYETYGSAP
jgi:hypothetical protein